MFDTLVDISKTIHQNPESGFKEFKACELLTSVVRKHGFEVEKGLAGLDTALVASFRSKKPGPAVAFLAEYDALPEIGHACGHNWIAAASTGAAIALKEVLEYTGGSSWLIGAPAEEGAVDRAGGKIVLLEAGVFEPIDVALIVHPSNRTVIETTSTAREALEMAFHGKAAHAAGSAHEGISALDALILAFCSMNALKQQMGNEVNIHGIITKGGVSPNIVPDLTEARIYVRAPDTNTLRVASEKVRNCATAAASSIGVTVTFRKFAHTYEGLRINRTLAGLFAENLTSLGVTIDAFSGEGSGSTDVGNVSRAVPCIHPYMRIVNSSVSVHTREFAMAAIGATANKALCYAAKAMSMTGVDVLVDRNKLKEIFSEFGRQNR